MSRSLVLNASYEPLCVVAARRAVVLVLVDKAETVAETGLVLHSERLVVSVPSVVRLRQFVTVPFRRRGAGRGAPSPPRPPPRAQRPGGVFFAPQPEVARRATGPPRGVRTAQRSPDRPAKPARSSGGGPRREPLPPPPPASSAPP